MIFQAGRRTAKKMEKNAHFVLKICTNRFRDYITYSLHLILILIYANNLQKYNKISTLTN